VKIDGDLDVSQRLAVAENGATSLICRNARNPALLQLAKDRSLLGKCRQNGETADSRSFSSCARVWI